jgi:hypothetical protein
MALSARDICVCVSHALDSLVVMPYCFSSMFPIILFELVGVTGTNLVHAHAVGEWT